MERYSIFLGWKNQYDENDYITKSNLQMQCNPFKSPMAFFTIHMETQDLKQPK